MPSPSIKDIQETLDYNQVTGIFTHKDGNRRKSIVGTPAGHKNKRGYIELRVNRTTLLAHRVAMALSLGRMPEAVDHINGVFDDNRIINLREVKQKENTQNSKRYRTNKSGVGGVCFHKDRKKYRASIGGAHSAYYVMLGEYHDFFEAVCARKSAEIKYGFHNNHGKTREERAETT